ncbi:MAG: M20/M25/M40 family metallo-hydrolase [Verrucomicrobia bacterium]|nr:M20/M25/M40 family metallo-hydrolase [Verrucomicrobiota bacterium]
MKNRLARAVLLFVSAIAVTANISAASPAGEAQFLTNTRQLIYEGKRSGEGYFSPDGKALIFQSEREPENPFYQIYILNLETGDSHRVSPGIGKTTCSFFRPGSDEVLFASTHLDPLAKQKQQDELAFRASGKSRRYSWDYDEHMDIFAAKRDGTQIRQLTKSPGYDAEGSYSPDGKHIAFCSLRDAYPTNKLSEADLKRLETDPAYFGEIYIMNADGSGQKRLTFTPGYDGGPFFSPDGQRIIWRRFDTNGATADVFTMKLDGTDERRLTTFGAMSWAPMFHPSGKYVIFTANKQGFANFELFLVDPIGAREPVRVTFTDGFDGLPVFSPDGKKLCWTSGRTADGKSQLFMADWNHEAAMKAVFSGPLRVDLNQPQEEEKLPPDQKQAFKKLIDSAIFDGSLGIGSSGIIRRFKLGAYYLSPEIKADDTKAMVNYLAGDSLDGRLTGTPGAQNAAEFLSDYFTGTHLQPLGVSNTFFQPFDFNSGVRLVTNQNSLTVTRANASAAANPFEVEKDFRPLAFSASAEVQGDVVFAGYGLNVPGKPGEGYDSYAGLDVSNKVVLVLRYVPEDVDAKRRQELNRYAGLRYKALIARTRGAKALLVVTGPTSPNAGQLAALTFESSAGGGSGIVAASVSGRVAAQLFQGSGKDLKTLQAALDKEDPHAEGSFALTNARVKLNAAVEHIKKQDRNVLGVIPPRGTSEYVVVGAHYDHLGHGETGGFARKDEEGKIHPGADDNASGTAAVLELAASLADERKKNPASFQRGIIFALWSGEELGLLGSAHFVEHPSVPLSNVVAYVNFDMVGRLRDNKLTLQGVGSSTAWRKLIEKRNVAAGFNLTLQDDPYLPTDVTSFYPKNVPVLSFFTGSHEEYHRPADKPDTLNYDGLERITKFARGLVLDLAKNAERPDYAKVARSDTGGGGREQLRAYLGTIPDYATEVTGVKLSGTRAGSPADKAGLKGGDVIVEFNGQKVANIYDYTFAMDAAKIGKPVKIIVVRDGQRVTLEATPEARK